jgi:hypothetical protein
MLCENAIATVQANMCKRVLRASVARGHMEARDAKDMAAYAHGGGFSVDAGVRIEAPDRAGLERLLRCCAGPSLAMDRLKQHGADLVCGCGKGHSEPLQSEKYSGELVLTPPELINRIAQLVPPPRTHRDRCCGVLAPNPPLRAAVTAMAQAAAPVVVSCCVHHLQRRPSTSARFWRTSESNRKRRASPRDAGHRCGTGVVLRRWAGVWRALPDWDLADQRTTW